MTERTARRWFNVVRLTGAAILFAGAFVVYRRLGLSVVWSLFFTMMAMPAAVVIASTLWRLATHSRTIAPYPASGD